MDLKLCSKCKNKKPNSSFGWKDKNRRKLHYVCRDCHADYRREHYLKHKKKYIAKAKIWNGRQKQILYKFLLDYFAKHYCVDCGERDIRVLEFDHTRDKKMNVTVMVKRCYSLSVLQKEIAKCEVRCANCHRKKSFTLSGSWRMRGV